MYINMVLIKLESTINLPPCVRGRGVSPRAALDFIYFARVDIQRGVWYNLIWKLDEQSRSKSRMRGVYDVPQDQWCDAKYLESHTSIIEYDD